MSEQRPIGPLLEGAEAAGDQESPAPATCRRCAFPTHDDSSLCLVCRDDLEYYGERGQPDRLAWLG